jgi:hypothetical protein
MHEPETMCKLVKDIKVHELVGGGRARGTQRYSNGVSTRIYRRLMASSPW